jgi:hypothetical protein
MHYEVRKDITIRIDARNHKEEEVTLPCNMKIAELLPEVVTALNLPTVDENGRPLDWRLSDKKTGRPLDPEKTLQENGIQPGDELKLDTPPEPSPDLQFRIQIEGRGAEEVRLPPDFKTQALIDQFRDPTDRGSEWRLTDKSTGHDLDPAKSLTENGVRSGDELLLISKKVDPVIPVPPTPWGRIAALVFFWGLTIFLFAIWSFLKTHNIRQIPFILLNTYRYDMGPFGLLVLLLVFGTICMTIWVNHSLKGSNKRR